MSGKNNRLIDYETQKRADGVIAQRALTNSKRPASFVEGFYPTHLVRGEGGMVTDTAGNRYVDFICGLGTNLLGYGQSSVVAACEKALRTGPTLSLSSNIEVILGEKIREIMPFVERIKVLKSGSEGCTAAVRIARAYTGRSEILTQGYNGWHDEFVSMQPPAMGVIGPFQISKLIDIAQITSETAAVILEPVITSIADDRFSFLRELREKCTKTGTVLIFDETITALRFPNFCVANWSSIRPDIIVFGKALGNGMPISVVGGKKEIMNCGEYFVSSTFAGERVSIAAGIEVIGLLQRGFDIGHFWESGRRFVETFNSTVPDVRIEGYPTRGVLTGDPMAKALFMQEACRGGLLFGASWFFAFPHIDQMDQIVSTLKEVVMRMKITTPRLEGKLPQSPFAQKMREGKT